MGKTTAKKGVDDCNSYKEFHERELEGHILAAFMVFTGMHSMEGMLHFYKKWLLHVKVPDENTWPDCILSHKYAACQSAKWNRIYWFKCKKFL